MFAGWKQKLVVALFAVVVAAGMGLFLEMKYRRVKERWQQAEKCLDEIKSFREDLCSVLVRQKKEQPATIAWEAYLTQGPDHPLGIPVVYAPESVPPPSCYLPKRKGMKVRYLGNHFQAQLQNDVLYRPVRSGKEDPLVLDQVSGGKLEPGEELTILADEFYDFAVGSLFVKVLRHKTNQQGYLDHTTLIGETAPSTINAANLMVQFADARLYNVCPMPREAFEKNIQDAQKKTYLGEDGDLKKVSPVSAGLYMVGGLMATLDKDCDPDLKAQMIAVGEEFFKDYGTPFATTLPDGSVAWPHQNEWPLHWQIKLTPPWYSGYGNAIMVLSAEILYHHTKKPEYRELAEKGLKFLRTPMRKGGALYYMGRFPHLAEYVYSSPAVPNIRIFDGEMIAVICIYDLALLKKDTGLLDFSVQLMAGLSVELDMVTTTDGKILNARYPWLIDNQGYLNCMRNWANALGEMSKDAAFFEAAKRWNLSKEVWR